MSIFGTRPEAIKMAPVVHALSDAPNIESIVCVTGQHRDMLDQVLTLFNIVPDEDLNLMRPNQSLHTLTARMIDGLHPLFSKASTRCCIGSWRYDFMPCRCTSRILRTDSSWTCGKLDYVRTT